MSSLFTRYLTIASVSRIWVMLLLVPSFNLQAKNSPQQKKAANEAKLSKAKAKTPKGNGASKNSSKVEEIQKIKKIELLKSKNGVGLRFTCTGDIQIKQGVIPKSKSEPRRVYFDLTRAALAVWTPPTYSVFKDGIKKIRLAQNKSDTVRVVVETEMAMPFHVKAKNGPVEIWFGGSAPIIQTTKDEKAAPIKQSSVAVSLLGLKMRKIVIDPGHGGHDPGAIGKNGLQEKDVTLALSKRLKSAIEEEMPGVQVLLTRDTDKFIALPKRTEFANNHHADLFISVHVNSSTNRETQGIETYYLNITHDKYARRLASRENAMSETEISNLEFILADLAMKSNISDSVRLGQDLQSNVVDHMTGSWSDVKDLGLKHALFYVLLGARMPAVLLETAFISNIEDEKRLRTKKYQDAIVTGMVKGLKSFSDQKQAMYQPKPEIN